MTYFPVPYGVHSTLSPTEFKIRVAIIVVPLFAFLWYTRTVIFSLKMVLVSVKAMFTRRQ